MKKNYLNIILENKIIKIYICTIIYLSIFISLYFDLNNKLIFVSIFFEDILYFVLLNIILVLLALKNINNYNLDFIFKNKIWLFIILILLVFYLKKFDPNYIKLIIYILPLILVTEVKKVFSLININTILKSLKLSIFLIFILVILESIIFYAFNTTFENIFFNYDSYNFSEVKKSLNSNINVKFYELIKSNIGFRPKLFLSNPITIYINCVLLSIILIHFSKINKFILLILKSLVGIYCKTRLILITPIFFFSDIKKIFYKKQTKDIYIFIFLTLIILLSLFFVFDLKDFKYQQIYNSRLIFYSQFIKQYVNYFELLLPKEEIVFFDISNNLTGPHSDFIYLTTNFGILISILFITKLFLIIKRLKSMSLIILAILFFNGIIFHSFFWITLYILIAYDNFNNNTYHKQT